MQVSFRGLKNKDLKNMISIKSKRFTTRTGFDLYPSTLFYLVSYASSYLTGNFSIKSAKPIFLLFQCGVSSKKNIESVTFSALGQGKALLSLLRHQLAQGKCHRPLENVHWSWPQSRSNIVFFFKCSQRVRGPIQQKSTRYTYSCNCSIIFPDCDIKFLKTSLHTYMCLRVSFSDAAIIILPCEPEGGLWSKGCSASQKQSWKYTEFHYMIQGSRSPGQQCSPSLVEAKMAGADSLCPKLVNSSSRGGFHADDLKS